MAAERAATAAAAEAVSKAAAAATAAVAAHAISSMTSLADDGSVDGDEGDGSASGAALPRPARPIGRVELRMRVLLDLCESVSSSTVGSTDMGVGAHAGVSQPTALEQGGCGHGESSDHDRSFAQAMHEERRRLLECPQALLDDDEFALTVAAVIRLGESHRELSQAGVEADDLAVIDLGKRADSDEEGNNANYDAYVPP